MKIEGVLEDKGFLVIPKDINGESLRGGTRRRTEKEAIECGSELIINGNGLGDFVHSVMITPYISLMRDPIKR